MIKRIHIKLILLATGMALISVSTLATEPTQDMRALARLYTALEARDLTGYCASMQTESYAGYLTRVC